MKVVHVSTSDMGGAGIAARRLHLAMLRRGIRSKLLTLFIHGVRAKEHYLLDETLDPSLSRRIGQRVQATLRYRAPWMFRDPEKILEGRPSGYEKFSFPFGRRDLHASSLIREADVVNLHWVSDGMLDYSSFFPRVSKPVVWTLHDMNPFTGGCHHADGSLEFRVDCRNCRQLKGARDEAAAAKNLSVKLRAMRNLDQRGVAIVSPSQWLVDLSASSRLLGRFAHHAIPNALDDSAFTGRDKTAAREKFGIPPGKKVVLFVANDVSNPRKGIGQLMEAVSRLGDDVVVCAVGKKMPHAPVYMPLIELGLLVDAQETADAYAMADVFVLPSVAENFPNTIGEALLCGVPVVATDVGGIREQVGAADGILVDNNTPDALVAAIGKVIFGSVKFDQQDISRRAHERFSDERIVNEYVRVYSPMIDGRT